VVAPPYAPDVGPSRAAQMGATGRYTTSVAVAELRE
jgi:hypothetical protein